MSKNGKKAPRVRVKSVDATTLPQLPHGWSWAVLDDLAASTPNAITDGPFGSNLKTAHYTNVGPRVIRLQNVGDGHFNDEYAHISEEHFDSLSRHHVQAGDLVIAALGESLPRACVVPEWVGPALVKADCPRFRPNKELVLSAYVCYSLNSHSTRTRTSRIIHGVGRPRLNLSEIRGVWVPVAPLNEQRRIVERIEELFSELDAGVAALSRVQANLKRYRASVLKAAVEGRLTEEWRAKHSPKETGEELLKRILEERRRKWEADQLAAYEAKDKEPPNGWQARYKEAEPVDLTDLPELPAGWCWSTMDAVADVTGGITKGWKRKTSVKTRHVAYLRVANVQRGFLNLDEIKTIEAPLEKIEALRLEPGDILFNEGGDRDKLGRGWVWQGQVEDCIHQNHVFRARPFSSDMVSELISHHGNTFGRLWFMRTGKQSVNLASISLSTLRQFPVPVAPVEEQLQIAQEVESVLTNIDKTTEFVEKQLARAARLRQSILQDAFEGKLVAQDPADEPASELLARIKAERQAAAPKPKKAARRTKRVSKKITQRRGAIVAYTIAQTNGKTTRKSEVLGRTKLVKALYVAQTHEELDLQFHFQRYAAGPFDEAVYKLEGTGNKNDWFATKERDNYGVTYHSADNTDSMCEEATEYLGDRKDSIDRLLGHIAKMDIKQAELFATCYAAWNDLLIDGRKAAQTSIIEEFHGWDESKKKFTKTEIKKQLKWMRANDYVPTGKGERTTRREKETKLPSRRRKKK